MGIIIKKALYGNLDVKDIIQNKCIKNEIIHFPVNNDIFTDPAPGTIKTLDIEFEYNGVLIKELLNEGENYYYPKQKYIPENSLVLTSCNRIEQVLLAIAINKEIIKEDFNLIVADCSTPYLDSNKGTKMHGGDDPYNLITEQNYNPYYNMIEDYVKGIPKIKKFMMVHVSPRLSKQVGESVLISLGLNAAALLGSKYAVKLTGVCTLKYDIFAKLNEYVNDKSVATWTRTGFGNQKSTRVFACKADELSSLLTNAGWIDWVTDKYDFVERKFEKIINNGESVNHMNLNEVDILVDEGFGRKDHRKIIYENLEKHNLLNSEDIWIRKFLNGGIW